MKYTVELTADDCRLIVTNCMVFGALSSTLKRMSKKPGAHKIKMTIKEMNEISGWLAAEANHCKDPLLEMDLHQLWEKFESHVFNARRQQIQSQGKVEIG